MRAPYALVAGVILTCSIAAPALASGGVVVTIDQSVPVRLSGTAAQVVVANPAIADASLLSRGQIAINGRTYGTTNIMVFDAAGRTIYNGLVTVTSPSSNQVALYRGAVSHHFTCASHCERTPVPGEPSEGVYQPYANAVRDYADRSKAAAQSSAQQP
jgi:hypothetical protein